MASTQYKDLGKVSITPKKEVWTSLQNVERNDIWRFGDGKYLALVDNPSIAPNDDGINWFQLSSNGKSAYQLAVDNGYTGTEEEWVNSLSQPSKDAAAMAILAVNSIDQRFPEKMDEIETELQKTIDDSVATKATKPYTLSPIETLVGTYKMDSTMGDVNIYEKTITLESLPNTLNGTSEYIISDEPLGFGIYMDVDSFSASSGQGLSKEFFQFNYQIVRLYIDDNLNSKVVIKCINTTTETIDGILHIRYCKFVGDVVEFNVVLPNTIDKSQISLEIPTLKFNKKFLFSYINDDSYSIFQYIFSAINKRLLVTSYRPSPTDTREMTWHLNMESNPTELAKVLSSYTPTDFLQCTDGAGVKRRFATTVACWPDKLKDQYIGEDVGGFWPWISEKEFKYFKDFGYMLGYHDLNGYDSTTTTQALFDICMANTVKVFNDNVGITPKLMIEPNGDHAYLTFCQNNPTVQVMTAQDGVPLIQNVYPFKSGFTLNKSKVAIERWFYDSNNIDYPAALLNALSTYHSATDKSTIQWLIGSAHHSDKWETDMFTQINSLYGDKGDDSIWVPTLDEMFEYTFMREGTVWRKTITDTGVKFKLFVPKMDNFFFRDLSVLLSGISDITGVTVSSGDNVYGTSFGISDNKLLVNLDFNPETLTKVEKYVSDYEENYNQKYKYDDAYYFVQRLKDGLRQPYLTRLNVHTSPPVFSGLVINSGEESTQNQVVVLNMSYTGQAPTQYMASENDSFYGAIWKDFTSSANFTLSNTYETKHIYVKLKNPYGESNTMSSTITLLEPTLNLTSISITQGSSTTSRDISIVPSYVGSANQYMISENSDFSGANWTTYSGGNIPYTLSDGYGNKTIYLKLKNDLVTTSSKSSSINYIDKTSAILNSISINNGDAETDNGTVSVGIDISNTITKYKIGKQPDLSDCTDWITWSGSPVPFISGITNGTLTVYVKVANTTSESDIKSDTISVIPDVILTSMTIGDGSGSHAGFTVPILLNTSSSTPTQYRLAENTTDLGNAAWVNWSTNIQYTFKSLGLKTLYGQVKNSVSISQVVNNTITITEVPIVILLANVVEAGLSVDGVGFVNSLVCGNGSAILKDTQGNSKGSIIGRYKPYNSTDFAALDSKYGVTHQDGNGTPAYWNKPTLPVTPGPYPNSIISDGTNNQISELINNGPTDTSANPMPICMLKDMTPGNYKVRILFSASSDQNYLNDLPDVIKVQNQTLQITTADLASKVNNNNSVFYTFDSVTVDSDGYLDVVQWSTVVHPSGKWGVGGPPACIVEITKL